MDDKDLAAFQKELARRLGLRKLKKYPEALTRILLRNYEFHSIMPT